MIIHYDFNKDLLCWQIFLKCIYDQQSPSRKFNPFLGLELKQWEVYELQVCDSCGLATSVWTMTKTTGCRKFVCFFYMKSIFSSPKHLNKQWRESRKSQGESKQVRKGVFKAFNSLLNWKWQFMKHKILFFKSLYSLFILMKYKCIW